MAQLNLAPSPIPMGGPGMRDANNQMPLYRPIQQQSKLDIFQLTNYTFSMKVCLTACPSHSFPSHLHVCAG